MTYIILSFFAVIGLALLVIRFLDYLFYRSIHSGGKLILDMRGKNEEEIFLILELIATVRDRKSGEAAIEELYLITDRSCHFNRDGLERLLSVFSLPGRVIDEEAHPGLIFTEIEKG